MEIYYHLKAERDEELMADCGIEAFDLTLMTASEDGYEDVAKLIGVSTEEKALIEAAWRQPHSGGNPALVFAILRGLQQRDPGAE